MTDNQIALLRFPAFLIDMVAIMAPLIIFIIAGWVTHLEVEWVMFLYIPIMFFIYWVSNINIGKRMFSLRVVDADTGNKATAFQLFKRALLFSFIVSLNLAFIIPLFLSKKHQSFHDMLANTVVIKDNKK